MYLYLYLYAVYNTHIYIYIYIYIFIYIYMYIHTSTLVDKVAQNAGPGKPCGAWPGEGPACNQPIEANNWVFFFNYF
jgi:hypothetical protein